MNLSIKYKIEEGEIMKKSQLRKIIKEELLKEEFSKTQQTTIDKFVYKEKEDIAEFIFNLIAFNSLKKFEDKLKYYLKTDIFNKQEYDEKIALEYLKDRIIKTFVK